MQNKKDIWISDSTNKKVKGIKESFNLALS